MRVKRLISWLLAAALTASLAVMPMGAAGSSFTDVSDQETAVNADILRLMGVVDGVGGDRFNPNASLTRAEFCTMVVKFMQKGDQVALHATRTIFADVTAKHWALGYVNLAASLRLKDGDQEVALISGVGNGNFEPDSKITLAQAATILIRVLGYSSQQAGAVWPQSYLNLASSIGLTDGVSAKAGDVITRAQAAQLFANALSCKTGDGQVYYETLGTVKDDTIILAVNVTTDDGSTDGAIRTTDNKDAESYLAAAGNVKPAALVGKRGALVLNDKNEIITFVPDDSNAVTITLSGAAQPSYVKGTNGQQYTMSKDTLLYTADASGGKAWLDGYTALTSGTQVTIYTESGKVEAVYASGSAIGSSDDAVVVTGTAGVAMFHQLTGGATNFTIQKNRQTISMSDIKPYDVVTYDSLSNTLIVSDLRLTCVYENASPNAKAPTEITVLGHTFEVLDSAWTMTEDFSVGNIVSLLLTADGKVAGMAKASGNTRSTAIGMVSGGGVDLFLPNGGTLTLTGTVDNASKLTDQLVNISSSAKGKISVSRLSAKSASSDFQVAEMTLGSYKVAAGVRMYEQVSGGAMVPIEMSQLGLDRVPANKIAAYHLNSSGMVDYLVLDSVTGDAYEYGMMLVTTSSGEDETVRQWSLHRGGAGIDFAAQVAYSGKNGSFAGVVPGVNVNGDTSIRATVELTEIENVSPSDFFTSQGVTYVTAGGKTYRVADDVECCRASGNSRRPEDTTWFTQETGEARLSACKAFSSDLTIYVDPVGQRVRVVEAN